MARDPLKQPRREEAGAAKWRLGGAMMAARRQVAMGQRAGPRQEPRGAGRLRAAPGLAARGGSAGSPALICGLAASVRAQGTLGHLVLNAALAAHRHAPRCRVRTWRRGEQRCLQRPWSCSGDEAAKGSQEGSAPRSEQLPKLPRQPQHTKPEGNAFPALQLALS